MGNMCQSEGVCAPFGRGLVNVQFPECTFILDIYNTANNWGICISWRVSVSPLGTSLGNIHFLIYTFVLDILILIGGHMSV